MPRALVRAVVDTNILVRGILRRREAAAVRLFDALVRGDFRALVSDYILSEASKTLREPDVRALRRLENNEIDALVGALREIKVYGIKDLDSPRFPQKGGVIVFAMKGMVPGREPRPSGSMPLLGSRPTRFSTTGRWEGGDSRMCHLGNLLETS